LQYYYEYNRKKTSVYHTVNGDLHCFTVHTSKTYLTSLFCSQTGFRSLAVTTYDAGSTATAELYNAGIDKLVRRLDAAVLGTVRMSTKVINKPVVSIIRNVKLVKFVKHGGLSNCVKRFIKI